jgi:RimJ/RimL family protein N-acetyltransferase
MRIEPLETPRLLIRQFEPGDWAAVHAYMSDPAVTEFLPQGLLNEQQTQAFVAENAGDEASNFALVLKPGGELIGHMPFHPWYAPRTFEVGWAVHRTHQRQGYATEAARELLRHGFHDLGLHRIIATCQPQNAPSWRVAEKLGMRREAHFQQCIQRDDSTWWDEYFYALLGEEWRAGQRPTS